MADLNTFLAENRKDPNKPADLRAAIAMTNELQANQGTLPYLKNAANSTARGLAQVAELPWNIYNNAPRLLNLLPNYEGVGKLTDLAKEAGDPLANVGEDPLIHVASKIPGMGGVGGIETPNPNYPMTLNIMEGFGTGLGGMGVTGAVAKAAGATPGIVGKFAQYMSAPAAPKTAIAAELAASAGGETGRKVAEDNKWGPIASFMAQMLGSMGPAALTYSAPQAAGRLFRRASNEEPLTILDRLKGLTSDGGAGKQSLEAMDRQGITPSIGLTGNRMGAATEAGINATPGFGSIVENKTTKQFGQFENAVKRLSDKIRPKGSAGASNLDQMARQVHDIAGEGLDKLKSGFGEREDALAQAITDNIDVTNTRNAIMSEMQTAGPKAKQILQNELDNLGSMIDETGKVPYQNFKNWRSEFGAGIEDQGIIKGVKDQVYKGAVNDLQAAANNAGVGDEFTKLMSEQATANAKSSVGGGGEIPALRDIVNAKDLGKAKTFFNDAMLNPDKAVMLKNSGTSEQIANFKANLVEHLGLAKPGFQNEAGNAISPTQFAKNWGKLDPRIKNIWFDDPQIRQTLDDIALISKDFERRGLEANTSRTAGTGLSAMTIQHAAKALNPLGGLATGAAAAGGYANAPATAGTLLTLYGLSKGLLSETLARWAAGQTPTIQSTMGARLPGAAARSLSNAGEGDQQK